MISFAPIFVKLASREGVEPSAIGAWRTLLGSGLLFAVARARGARLVPPASLMRVAVVAGVAFAADLFAWHRSIVLIGAGMATIFGNTQVFWTSSYGRVAYGEPLSGRFVAAAALAFGGVVLLAGVGSDIAFTRDHVGGVAFGLATGLLYAIYILAVQRGAGGGAPRTVDAAGDLDPITRSTLLLAWITLFTAALLFAAGAAEGEALVPSTWRAFGYLAALAVAVQVVGWLLLATGLRGTPASTAALLFLIQPTLATVWGVLFFDEQLTALQVVGAGVTLGAIYLGSTARRA